MKVTTHVVTALGNELFIIAHRQITVLFSWCELVLLPVYSMLQNEDEERKKRREKCVFQCEIVGRSAGTQRHACVGLSQARYVFIPLVSESAVFLITFTLCEKI